MSAAAGTPGQAGGGVEALKALAREWREKADEPDRIEASATSYRIAARSLEDTIAAQDAIAAAPRDTTADEVAMLVADWRKTVDSLKDRRSRGDARERNTLRVVIGQVEAVIAGQPQPIILRMDAPEPAVPYEASLIPERLEPQPAPATADGQAAPAAARQALEEAVEHAIQVTPAGSGTAAVMRAVDAYVFARYRDKQPAPELAAAMAVRGMTPGRVVFEAWRGNDAASALVPGWDGMGDGDRARWERAARTVAGALADYGIKLSALLDLNHKLAWQTGLPGERARVAAEREQAGMEALG